MRISDWSSDVCSAYLGGAARRFSARLAARPRTVANPRKERTMIRAVILSASLAALAVPAAAQPAAKVAAANKAALREPSSAGFIRAVQIYPYTEGALYRLYAAPERVTDIALQPGETIISVAAGDTVR